MNNILTTTTDSLHAMQLTAIKIQKLSLMMKPDLNKCRASNILKINIWITDVTYYKPLCILKNHAPTCNSEFERNLTSSGSVTPHPLLAGAQRCDPSDRMF